MKYIFNMITKCSTEYFRSDKIIEKESIICHRITSKIPYRNLYKLLDFCYFYSKSLHHH